MPSSKGFRKAKDERSPEAFALGDILQALMQRKEFKVGAPLGKLMSGWEQIVGERLAAETVPTGLERGTLSVAASSGAWATQVRFLAEEVRRRANEELGSAVVRQVRVTVRKTL
jgi:predicted nucleic acid-binding Zn ribbon protein